MIYVSPVKYVYKKLVNSNQELEGLKIYYPEGEIVKQERRMRIIGISMFVSLFYMPLAILFMGYLNSRHHVLYGTLLSLGISYVIGRIISYRYIVETIEINKLRQEIIIFYKQFKWQRKKIVPFSKINGIQITEFESGEYNLSLRGKQKIELSTHRSITRNLKKALQSRQALLANIIGLPRSRITYDKVESGGC